MRNTLLILMISVHLAGNTEIGQLLRVPELITHFFQHHRQDPTVSFWDFIAMHYGGDDGTTADDDSDQRLPCHNFNHHTIAHIFSPMVKDPLSSEIILPAPRSYNSRIVEGIPAKHVRLLLQPPRTA